VSPPQHRAAALVSILPERLIDGSPSVGSTSTSPPRAAPDLHEGQHIDPILGHLPLVSIEEAPVPATHVSPTPSHPRSLLGPIRIRTLLGASRGSCSWSPHQLSRRHCLRFRPKRGLAKRLLRQPNRLSSPRRVGHMQIPAARKTQPRLVFISIP